MAVSQRGAGSDMAKADVTGVARMTLTTTLLAFLFAVPAFANTEVVKYSISDIFPPLPLASPDPRWPVLSQSQPDLKFNITPAPSVSACRAVDEQCQHHLWMVLNMTDPRWSFHRSYMLRVSWPAMVCVYFFQNLEEILTARFI